MSDRKLRIGCPPIFRDSDDLQKAVDKYFQNPPTRKISIGDGQTLDVPHLTITGLCIDLGFASRQSFYDYEKNDKFSYIIKRARLFIENEYESLLKAGQCTGAIFALKNMGWKDTQVIEAGVKEVKSFNDMYDD